MATGLPLLTTLATIIIGGSVAWTTVKLTVDAHGEDIDTLQAVDYEFRPRINDLEKAQEGMYSTLQAIQKAQELDNTRQAADRKIMVDAIRDLTRRIDQGNSP